MSQRGSPQPDWEQCCITVLLRASHGRTARTCCGLEMLPWTPPRCWRRGWCNRPSPMRRRSGWSRVRVDTCRHRMVGWRCSTRPPPRRWRSGSSRVSDDKCAFRLPLLLLSASLPQNWAPTAIKVSSLAYWEGRLSNNPRGLVWYKHITLWVYVHMVKDQLRLNVE
jgi:hypothetical protein